MATRSKQSAVLIGGSAMFNSDRELLLGDTTEKLTISYGSLTTNSENSSAENERRRERCKAWRKKHKGKPHKRGIFSFSTALDYVLIFLGTLASALHGAGFPLLSIVLGGMTSVFLRAENSEFVNGGGTPGNASSRNETGSLPPLSREEFEREVFLYSIYYLMLGVVMFVTSYIQIACWEAVAERVAHRLRQNYLLSVLRQDISWFDTVQSGNLTARLTDDLERVREGLGDKFSLFIQLTAAFLSSFIVGFFYSWQMTLVMALFTPAIALTSAWMGRMTATRTQVEQEKYAVAGAIAEETLSSMRTIHALNAEQQELERYEVALEDGRKTGLLKYLYMAFGVGISNIITHVSFAVAFWYASRLVLWDPDFNRGAVFTVFFAVMSGSTALGGALPHFASISSAKGAARHVLRVINRKPLIDPYADEGNVLWEVKGAIRFEDVHFFYPLRKEVKVLRGVSFSLEPGKKLALVGPSGCGKSTIVNLLLRFYDPSNGTVLLDEQNLKTLNVRWLRDQIGVVSQEPILFDGTLEENIMLGNEDASHEQLLDCCRKANALEFIDKLSDGFRTRVGERGAQLSGGQKQRIAIARALIKNPRILLLDEATSALDTESEAIVQRALNQAQEGRTTIIVAHRLATIREVDQILVFKEGRIVEAGLHEELYNRRGIFYEMINQQQIQQRDAKRALRIVEEEGNGPADQTEEKTFVPAEKTISVPAVSLVVPLSSSEAQPLLPQTPSGSSAGAESSRKPSHSFPQVEIGGSKKNVKSPSSPVVPLKGLRRRRTSESSDAIQISQMQLEVEEDKAKPSSIAKVFCFNKGNWGFAFLGLLGCSLSGLVVPFFALVYAQIFVVFSEPPEQLESDSLFWSAMFLVLGFCSALGFFISANMLGRSGEALTKKLRLESFRNLLRQDIAFFDDERHNTGKLCTRFATDAPNVRYVFTRFMVVISSVVTLIGAIMIGFLNGWKLALILLAIIPLIIASGYFEMQQQFGKKMRDTELLEEAGKVASEAVANIRTVHGLNKQVVFHRKYCEQLVSPHRANMCQVHVYGAVFAFSQSLIFFMYALAFWVGSLFVLDGSMSPTAVFRVFFAIAFCGQSVGQISSFIPDVVKARLAASLLFHMIEYPPLIDSLSDFGVDRAIKGHIQFRSVYFSYPSRPGVPVLRGLSLEVLSGQTVALVGYSGCGKSTVMALLERYYSPLRGSILLDGIPIEDMNIHKLRSQICIVSQEPILFDCSIRENIVYGLPEQENIPHEKIVNVCELANVHNFILGLPDGYDTRVGEKGVQLSGGQKQRIAIARALIREPSVLLLDEATSALDTENEKIVQNALEKAREGRTCLVIAHRLSTVQHSDLIAVIDEGRVVEKGTHAELFARTGGIYKALCETQILNDTNL